MKRIRTRFCIADVFFYLGMSLISVASWKYGWFGIQRFNALAEVPLIISLVARCIEKRIIIDKRLIVELILVISMLVYSLIQVSTNGYEVSKFLNGINIFGWYYLCFFSIRMFLADADWRKVEMMLVCIKNSFHISVIAGIVQFINIHVHRFGWYESFIEIFSVNRNDILTRIRLSFSEPSEAAIYLVFLYVPVVMMLKKIGYKFLFIDYCQMIALAILSILTFSISFYLVVLITIICFVLSSKRGFIAIISATVLIMIYFTAYYLKLFDVFITSDRVRMLFISPVQLFLSDDSIKTRICYYYVILFALERYPILGYGWNFFLLAMKDAVDRIPENIITNEFIYKTIALDEYVSYETLFCTFVCGGLLGGCWLVYVLRTRLICDNKIFKPLIISYIISLFLGMGMLRSIPIIVFMELCSNTCTKRLMEKNYAEYSYTM